jgi:hypothetical protein
VSSSVLKLHVNMRLCDPSLDAAQRADIEQFAAWIISIGDGTIRAERKGEEHEPSWIAIPEDLMIKLLPLWLKCS